MKIKKDKKYSFNHTKERFMERFGLLITYDEYDMLCKRVEKTDFISMENQKNDIQTVHEIIFKKNKIKVVFSKERKCITTVFK